MSVCTYVTVYHYVSAARDDRKSAAALVIADRAAEASRYLRVKTARRRTRVSLILFLKANKSGGQRGTAWSNLHSIRICTRLPRLLRNGRSLISAFTGHQRSNVEELARGKNSISITVSFVTVIDTLYSSRLQIDKEIVAKSPLSCGYDIVNSKLGRNKMAARKIGALFSNYWLSFAIIRARFSLRRAFVARARFVQF